MDREQKRQNLGRLIDESVALELLASDLYRLYAELFPYDAPFWRKLSLEEKNHASLIKSARMYLDLDILPEDVLFDKTASILEAAGEIRKFMEGSRGNSPSLEEACRFALRIEESAVELHYQKLMEKESESIVVNIFQKLGGDDKDHAERIRGYMRDRSISA